MLPTVLPGSTLRVALATSEAIELGDIVCYPTGGGIVVAHRVVGKSGVNGTAVLTIRGDAQTAAESVPRSAMAYVVKRVEHPLISYDTESTFGRMLSKIAVRHHALTRCIASTLGAPVRLISAVRSLRDTGLL